MCVYVCVCVCTCVFVRILSCYPGLCAKIFCSRPPRLHAPHAPLAHSRQQPGLPRRRHGQRVEAAGGVAGKQVNRQAQEAGGAPEHLCVCAALREHMCMCVYMCACVLVCVRVCVCVCVCVWKWKCALCVNKEKGRS